MTGLDLELIHCFLDEALDSLQAWERACLDLESHPTEERFNALFRAAHNIKGASRAVGLDEYGAFVHKIEDLITSTMKGKTPLTKGIIEVFLAAQVLLVEWTERLRSDPTFVPDGKPLCDKVTTLLQEPEAQHVPQSEASPPPPSQAPSKELDELEKAFWAAKQEYDAAEALKTQAVLPTTTGAAIPASTSDANKTPKDEARRIVADETIRIAASKLDELIQLVGELSIQQSIINQGRHSRTLDSRTAQNAIHLSQKITKDLHTKALSLRMQPVQGLFQRLERTGRDVARGQGKTVSVTMEGTDVELDKTVIERITDPLTHILRNAVDHGLEDPTQRRANGKDETGNIILAASQDAAGVCIKVTDDGKGLNKERILAKALEKILYDPIKSSLMAISTI